MHLPLFYARVRLQARAALRQRGYGFREINDIVYGADDETIDMAVTEAGAHEAVKALGDGTILQAIIDFLKSPAGQALIQALLSLLLGLI